MKDSIMAEIASTAQKLNAFALGSETIAYPEWGLPDRNKIIAITEQLRSLMFPGFFDIPAAVSNTYSTGYKLTGLCNELLLQSEKAFATVVGHDEAKVRAEEVINGFVAQLPKVQRLLATDVEAIYAGDPAAGSKIDVIFSYPGLFAIAVYRLAHELYRLKLPLIPRMMTEYAHGQTGIDINAGAKIGPYFFIDHGTGIVIGETTEIGENVKLYQGVTLGALSTRKGQLLAGVKRHPTLGNRVTVYSGASILGGETVIGDDCLIGGNAFVTGSVPPKTRVSIKSPELTFRELSTNVWENT